MNTRSSISSIIATLVVIASTFAQQKDSPKVVVGIVVDQMCYEYLYRFYPKYSERGFKRMMLNGTNCRNTNYNYIPTFTGPGHASIYTGTTPSNHGIVANDWYDRDTKQEINCVTDSTVKSVGTSSLYGLFSPVNLKSPTVTDQLKMTYPNAKVVSLSIKNRGAILPGGHLSDGSYWFDYSSGKMITSSFYAQQLPSWVVAFNDRKFADSAALTTWSTLLPIDRYVESQSDDRPYEQLLPGKTTPTFPYDLNEMTGGVVNYDLFTVTPAANTFLTEFAIAALTNEKMGSDGQTDMLCISYSTPDIAGHAFGPYSKEIEDMYIRLDLEIARLLDELDRTVGKGKYTLFLTADHAVVPVPQYLVDNGLPGGYFYLDQNLTNLRMLSIKEFGADVVEAVENLNVYVNWSEVERLKLNKEKVLSVLSDEIETWDAVKRVFTANKLYKTAMDDEWMDMVRNGVHHKESGDIIFMLEPGYLPKSTDVPIAHRGTSHGSAYNYDTQVPLLWYGAGIPVKEIFREVKITDIAATLSQLLYLQRPSTLTGEPILEILERSNMK